MARTYSFLFKQNIIKTRSKMTVCSYQVTYAFQSESTLYSCLNVKDLLAWNRHKIRSLSDCTWTQTHNHLVHKRTLNHFAKLAKLWLNGWVLVYKLSCCGFESSCSHLKISNVFIYFKLIFPLTISCSHFQSKINKIYIQIKL